MNYGHNFNNDSTERTLQELERKRPFQVNLLTSESKRSRNKNSHNCLEFLLSEDLLNNPKGVGMDRKVDRILCVSI